jgi:hypothetical protein
MLLPPLRVPLLVFFTCGLKLRRGQQATCLLPLIPQVRDSMVLSLVGLWPNMVLQTIVPSFKNVIP